MNGWYKHCSSSCRLVFGRNYSGGSGWTGEG